MDELEVVRHPGATGSTAILRLKGPVTLSTTIIDVTAVPYIDSAGLGTILSHWSHTQRHGKKFALTGISQRISVLLEVSKVNTILPTFRTVEEAERSFTGQTAKA